MSTGKEDRLRQKQQAELAKVGNQLRAEMAQKGKSLKEDHLKRLEELKKSSLEAESLKQEREDIKKEAESLENAALEVYRAEKEVEKQEKAKLESNENQQEAESTFKKYDSNQDGYIDLDEIRTRVVFDKNRDGYVDEEEAKYFLDNQETVNFETFLTLCWPKIKPYLMLDSGLFKPPATVEELYEKNKDENEPAASEHDGEDIDGDIIDAAAAEEEEGEEDYEQETGEGEVEPVDTGANTNAQPEYDSETKKLIESANSARNQFLETDRELREINNELKTIEDLLAVDYGPHEEFVPLHGECFNYEDREYVYKVCPFDRAVQQPKSGGAETKLGVWDRWQQLGDNNYSAMVFSNGAACWNGPQRSATVHLSCGLETKLTSVAEPNRCEYVCTLETPAACYVNNSNSNDDKHDEL